MTVLNIGSGPVEPGKTPGIDITNADRKDHPGAEYQDMENLDYEDESFDLVVCVNALDHTKDAEKALLEFMRVCEENGFVYIDCALIQKTTSGKGHYWDMLEDGTMTNGERSFSLKDYEFLTTHYPSNLERRYSHVIARWQKPMS